jgi:GT2 family glycosyltransferase
VNPAAPSFHAHKFILFQKPINAKQGVIEMSNPRIAVLITSFNRRETTLCCLAALHAQRALDNPHIETFLVDDRCNDGTGEAVREKFPGVHVLKSTGNLFWNGGMRMAFAVAMQGDFDAYLFLNDDTILEPDALERLIASTRACFASTPAIMVGSARSPASRKLSYGGYKVRKSGLSLRFDLVKPHPQKVIPCDTMNGNLVLIPAEVAKRIGNLEERFRHQFGDLDYGLRAKQAGFPILVAPGFLGHCAENSPAGTWKDQRTTFMRRWSNLLSPKGVPFREWILFTQRHYGWRFPVYALSPYLKTIVSSLLHPRPA